MFQFIKSNKMFAAAIASAAVLLTVICYGFAVNSDIAVVLGSILLYGAVAYILLSIAVHKELARR